MSNRKKPDARALFKKAKNRQADDSGTSAPTVGGARRATTPGSKYQGKSKEELLALLKLKQAQLASQQGAPTPQPRVAKAQSRQTPPASVKVPAVPVAKRAATTRPGPAQVSRSDGDGGALRGLLGVGADDSSDEDGEDDQDAAAQSSSKGPDPGRDKTDAASASAKNEQSSRGRRPAGESSPEREKSGVKPTGIPEGLPADFFDSVEEAGTSESEDTRKNAEAGTAQGTNDRSGPGLDARRGRANGGELNPSRVAQLEAEAAAEAERDEARLAAMRAAGLVVAVAPAVAEAGSQENAAGQGGDTDGADGVATDGAAGGTALPEGFFDDPEVDARSRGVDLEAKRKEEEQNDWREFMVFAEEVKKTEKEHEKQEEEEEEDKEQYEELEQAAMMGRLAVLMNTFEGVGRKRKRDEVSKAGPDAGRGADETDETATGRKERVGGTSAGSEARSKAEEAELSVQKAGSAMREVAVATAPADAAAVEISAMLRGRRRKKKEEVEEAFAGEYVPMDPLDWRSKGR